MQNRDNTLVSIITICLNAELTIIRTIESVLSQRNVTIQYIIVDGGSTDGTLKIINKYISRIDLLISEKDDGISDAINKGIKAATGDIIGILHSDDWYVEGALNKVCELLKDKKENVIIHSDVYYWLNDTTKSLKPSTTKGIKNPLWGCTIRHPSCFILKSTYDKVGLYNTDLKLSMDYEFFIRCNQASVKFIKSENILCNYSAGGLSKSNNLQLLKEEFIINTNARKMGPISAYLIWVIRYIYLTFFNSIKNQVYRLRTTK